MDALVVPLLKKMTEGGPESLSAALLLIVVGLILALRMARSDFKAKEKHLDEVIENYYEAIMKMADAVKSIEIVLAEMKGKL